ncbi:MAG: signal peptidase II [Haliscomenobacter sp.]|uniref:signal peptidase II n=1 Tax=Haliscomenobacter sp. TaxID=2717303 RepID=UPI0029B042BF|nr:signal peptidase II [Haliscomenobacter sp.]MDX2069672.1 signal peptidase II [Haliscomenobacter sp.]
MWQKRLIVLLIPGLLATVLDRLTKIWAVNTLKEQPMKSYLNDIFRLVYAENTGAFLSLGSGMNDTLRYWVLAVVPVLVLLYIFFHVLTAKNLHIVQQAAFGFILGGGLSNIYDRIMEGRVVDFMNMGFGTLRTGIFNVADMSIMLGLFLMVPFLFQKQAPSEAATTPVAAAEIAEEAAPEVEESAAQEEPAEDADQSPENKEGAQE